jgi:hypothetical protein
LLLKFKSKDHTNNSRWNDARTKARSREREYETQYAKGLTISSKPGKVHAAALEIIQGEFLISS